MTKFSGDSKWNSYIHWKYCIQSFLSSAYMDRIHGDEPPQSISRHPWKHVTESQQKNRVDIMVKERVGLELYNIPHNLLRITLERSWIAYRVTLHMSRFSTIHFIFQSWSTSSENSKSFPSHFSRLEIRKPIDYANYFWVGLNHSASNADELLSRWLRIGASHATQSIIPY